jgi:hypothetical protein
MARQLALLDTPPEWHLTDEAREAGRAGVARARAALAAAARSTEAGDDAARRPAA